jgi:PAS domain S-box-containing protein
MEPPIQILLLEDDPADAELIHTRLIEAGLTCRINLTQTGAQFETALLDGGADIILADYRLPMYDGMSALRLAKEVSAGLPFIFVSGTMGEEAAIEALTQGATDYVLKHNLSRLAPAVQRALTEARERLERRRAERALAESEIKMRTILDSVDESFIVLDRGFRILSANKAFCAMVDRSEEKVLGRTCHELLHHLAHPCYESDETCPVQYTLETGKSNFVTHKHPDGDGGQQFLELKSYPILDASGRLTAVIETLNNVTETKILQDQLRKAQKMEAIGTLAGGIAHDFNNLLFPIIGMAELLLEDLPADSPEYENAGIILEAGKRGMELIKQIMAFSRRSEGKKIPSRLQPILKEVTKLVRATIPSNISVSHDIQSDCGWVMADPIQIHQLVMNLITNAYHAVGNKEGKISIRLRQTRLDNEHLNDSLIGPGRYAELIVADTGCGIEAALMDKIFEPYFTSKEQGKGTGLGLSTVYGITKEHNGEINVDSDVGKGTTFTVYLPLMSTDDTVIPVEASQSLSLGNERIFLVDDDAAIAHLEKRMLKHLGYRVTSKVNSLEALETFAAAPDAFDLVITDMTMPNLTGDQLAKAIMAIRGDTPVIICTGFSERIDAQKAASIGVKAFLRKPIALAEMATTVRDVLDSVGNSPLNKNHRRKGTDA